MNLLAIREQRQRSIDFEAVQMFRKLEALPSKKIWIRRRREEIEAELDAKFARANFQAVDSFDHLSRSLFVSPEEIQDLYVRKEIIARNKWRILLLKVLCGNSQPDKRESAANHRQLANIHELKGALASSSKGQTALLEAFKVLAGSKSVMGQVLSVYRYIADMDPMKDDIPSPLSETDRSASTNSDKTLRLRTSHLTSRDATVGPSNVIDAQHVKGKQ